MELMDQSEEDTWKVKNILESGSVFSVMGRLPAAGRGCRLGRESGGWQLQGSGDRGSAVRDI